MSLPAEAVDRARQASILEVAKRYTALKRVAANEWVGPCPGCGGTDRFSINTRKQLFNCRGCGAKGDVIALSMHAGGATFAQTVAALSGEAQAAIRALPPRPRNPDPDEDADRNSRSALRIWDAARSIRGTLAEHYLVRVRDVDIDQILELDDVLRFEANCPFVGDNRLPCLIALVRDIVTDAPKAIQRTALGPAGREIDRRSLGQTKGGAIKLWEDAEVKRSGLMNSTPPTTAACGAQGEGANEKSEPGARTVGAPAQSIKRRL
jgi:putative DNA primase/helicase